MRVTVQLSTDVAESAKSAERQRLLEPFDLALKPLHAESDDPTLRRYYVVEVPDRAIAQRIVDHLLNTKGVEAAYVKPTDAEP